MKDSTKIATINEQRCGCKSIYTPTWTHNVATVAQKCPACGGQINYLCLSDLPMFDSTLLFPTPRTPLPPLISSSSFPFFFYVFPPLSLSLSLSPVDMRLLFLDVKPLLLPALVCVWYLPKLLWSGLGGTTERASWGSSECDQMLTPAVKGAVCVWKRHSGRGQLCGLGPSLY